jgi:thiol:disulfide interchange protein DsbA
MKSSIALVLVVLTCPVWAGPSKEVVLGPAGTTWEEGKQFAYVASRVQPGIGGEKNVQVIEFFMYGCLHCFALEPQVTLWNHNKSADINFVRVPLAYDRAGRDWARLYYTLEALGRMDGSTALDLHHEVFDAVHRLGNALTFPDEKHTLESHLEFAKRFGIDSREFTQTYHSNAVDDAVRRATELAKNYRIDGTPMFVVAQRYVTDVEREPDGWMLMALLDALASKAQAAMSGTARSSRARN